MKSPRLDRWADLRSGGWARAAGLHPPLNEGLLRALIPLRHWDPEGTSNSAPLIGDKDGAGENSWTRLALRWPDPLPSLQPLRSPEKPGARRGLELGVLAGVAGPLVRAWLLCSRRKFKKKGTKSRLGTCNLTRGSELSSSCHNANGCRQGWKQGKAPETK